MAEEEFDLSIRRTHEGVQVSLEKQGQVACRTLTEEEAARFLWEAASEIFPLRVKSIEDLQQCQPKAQVRPIALAWGAVGDGDLALTVFVHGIQPIALVLSDEQAQSVQQALGQSLRIPRELRTTKSKN